MKYRVSSKRKELYKLTYSIYDFYDTLDIKDKIDKKTYIALVREFFTMYVHKTIVERKRYKLPLIGLHRIKKRTPSIQSTPRIDFNKTKLYGTKIYHLNNHTNGSYFRWYWDKSGIRLKHKTFFRFELTKKHTLFLAKEIFKRANDPFTKDYDALT